MRNSSRHLRHLNTHSLNQEKSLSCTNENSMSSLDSLYKTLLQRHRRDEHQYRHKAHDRSIIKRVNILQHNIIHISMRNSSRHLRHLNTHSLNQEKSLSCTNENSMSSLDSLYKTLLQRHRRDEHQYRHKAHDRSISEELIYSTQYHSHNKNQKNSIF